MKKFKGTYVIPEWAIRYLVNGDPVGLTQEQIQETDTFRECLLHKYNASDIIFDTKTMDKNEYGTIFRSNFDPYPDFGRQFGACTTWRIPVYAEVPSFDREKFNIIVMGNNPLNSNKCEIKIFLNKSFCDMEEADGWVSVYYNFLNNFVYYIYNPKDTTISVVSGD